MRRSPEYRIWHHIIQRCHNPNDAAFPKYGARGISVCDSWRISFQAFYDDIGPRPSGKHTIDRIDSSGNYEPGNVRWATRTVQAINRRTPVGNGSSFRGVSRADTSGRWLATIGVDKKQFYIGTFDSEEEAAWMYDQWATELHGIYKQLNFDYVQAGFDIDGYMERSTRTSGVPIKLKDKTALRQIARMLK